MSVRRSRKAFWLIESRPLSKKDKISTPPFWRMCVRYMRLIREGIHVSHVENSFYSQSRFSLEVEEINIIKTNLIICRDSIIEYKNKPEFFTALDLL